MEEIYKDFKSLLIHRLREIKDLEETLLVDYLETLIEDLDRDE